LLFVHNALYRLKSLLTCSNGEGTKYKTTMHYHTFKVEMMMMMMITIIIMNKTIFIALSSTAPAICESSLWFLWAKVGQRQVAANS